MKMKGSIAVFAVAAAFAGNVAAQARVYCVDLIKVLEDQTIEAPFTSDRDRTTELGKLTDARLKTLVVQRGSLATARSSSAIPRFMLPLLE